MALADLIRGKRVQKNSSPPEATISNISKISISKPLMTDGATASNQVIGEYDQGVAVLARLARRYGHPPSDLLNYFRDDIADFATDPYAAEVIQLYIEHRAASWLLSERRDEYKPIIASDQSKPVLLAKAKPLVACETCAHFVTNPLNPRAGIGDCGINGEGSIQPVDRGKWHGKVKPPLYPRIERECRQYEVVTAE